MVYSVDANLNFPIARPQVLVVWSSIMALITGYHQEYKKNVQRVISNHKINLTLITLGLIIIVPCLYVTNQVYNSLKGQMYLLQDFNSNNYNLPINQVDDIVPDIPNITVTTIPINSVRRDIILCKKI